MKSATDLILARLARVPTVGYQTARFVSMEGALAVVNIGDQAVSIPCTGFYPPVEGMVVQVEQRNGQLVVTGPAVPLPPLGIISAGGSPKAQVTVAGVDYTLGYRAGYTPVIGDEVEINWATGIIQGQITAARVAPVSVVPNVPVTVSKLPTSPVLATDSGRFQNNWWANGPWASNNNTGAWFYGSRVRDALAGSTPTKIEIYLPLIQQLGNFQIGVHGSGSKPGGNVSGSLFTTVSSRSGWVTLPDAFATYLRDNVGGIIITAPGGGYNQFKGTQADALSGALRFAGSR